VNLLYLPTIIGLIIKYGPYVAQADAVLKQFGPVVQQLAGALVPVVEKNFGVLKAEAPADIVSGVQTVLAGLGHPTLSKDEQDVLTNRLSQMD
jgi:hypothetical protein